MNRQHSQAFIFAAILGVTCAGSRMSFGQSKPPAVPAAPGPVAAAPTMEELQTDLDQKQYAAAVKIASRLLNLHGPASEGLSRFQITMFKGEAQVGLKTLSAAAVTFKSALKETKDPHELALAKWTAELFARAKGTLYVPRTIGAGVDKTAPINLMDHDKRKDAFGAMLDDDLSKLSPDLKAAAVSQSLPQIFPVLEKVESLDQLDVIANGNDDKTAEAANALLDHSRNLLANALKSMWSRVSDIENHANIVTNTPNTLLVNGQYVTENISRKNGLSDANRTELKNDIATCSKIHDAAEVFIPMAKTDKDWPAILSDADRVAGRASDILNADYGQTTSQENPGGYNSGSYTGQGTYNGGNYTGQPLGGTGIPTTPVTPPKPPKPTTPTTPKTGSGN